MTTPGGSDLAAAADHIAAAEKQLRESGYLASGDGPRIAAGMAGVLGRAVDLAYLVAEAELDWRSPAYGTWMEAVDLLIKARAQLAAS